MIILANGCYLLAAALLAFVAALGTSLTILLVVAGVFVAVALALAVVQHSAGPAGGTTANLIFGAGAFGVGLLLLALFPLTHWDPLPVVGLTVGYVGAGYLVLGLRSSPGWRPGRSYACLGAAVVLIFLGIGLLPHATLLAAGCLGLGAAVFLPIGLNLASEDAQAWASDPQTKRGAWTGAGLAIALVVVIALVLVSHAPLAVTVGAVVAIVVVASIVSRTHLDTALALAVLVVISAAPPESSPDAVPKDGTGQHALIALGDSYMSGEGTSKFYAGTDDAGGNECRRSPHAYAARVGTTERYFDGLTFLACSGATVSNVLVTPPGERPDEQYDGQRTQLDELTDIVAKHPDFRPALVVVGIGGNDAGFARIGEACIAPGNCADQATAFLHRLDAVEHNVELVYRQVHELLPATTVLAVPYPAPIKSVRGCGSIGLAYTERVFIDEFLDQLDLRIERAAAATHTLYFAAMKDSLAQAHLQLCDHRKDGKTGLNFVKLTGQGAATNAAAARFNPNEWIHDSLHPTDDGHEAMAATFDQWLGTHEKLLTTSAYSVAAITPVKHGVDTRTVDLAAVRTWELEQVRDLWWCALVVLIGVGGLWVGTRLIM